VWTRSLPAIYFPGVATPHLLSVIEIVFLTQNTGKTALRTVKVPGTVIHVRGEHLKVLFLAQVVSMRIIVDTGAVLGVCTGPAKTINLRGLLAVLGCHVIQKVEVTLYVCSTASFTVPVLRAVVAVREVPGGRRGTVTTGKFRDAIRCSCRSRASCS